ncbi:MAG: flagellar hook associated protein [Sulfobacillus acidophilus]|uniref:Flagellar hook associated protein n=1 Tax=Sulfobacillus acidophilus TaxID=53633 RepID=A0A2T2WM84_9FIRM|nr:MAG: flagellar hook associated protein [Sulfobacillus acidophilus]
MNPVDGITPFTPAGATSAPGKAAPGFRELVQKAQAQVTFSHHAQQRMQERQIHLTLQQLGLLSQAMNQARTAGAKTAAVVMEPGIFIVAPGTNTVITTVPQKSEQPMQVISHVDTLVLVGRTSTEEASSPRATDGGQPAVHWSLIQNMEITRGGRTDV